MEAQRIADEMGRPLDDLTPDMKETKGMNLYVLVITCMFRRR